MSVAYFAKLRAFELSASQFFPRERKIANQFLAIALILPIYLSFQPDEHFEFDMIFKLLSHQLH
jgi:hypothetical protein